MKKILLRVDFNLTSDRLGSPIVDQFKILSHKPLIAKLVAEGNVIDLVSHISKDRMSFKGFYEKIGDILGLNLNFIPDCVGKKVDAALRDAQPGAVFLLENTRLSTGEEENSEEFAKILAMPFSEYINDAFSVCHRAHASIVAITKFLPSSAGPLIRKEIAKLSEVINAPKEGKTIILGGAKISTKLPAINNFTDKAENILIGGALANMFFKVEGVDIGNSLIEDYDQLKDKVAGLASEVVLPIDSYIDHGETLAVHQKKGPSMKMDFASIVPIQDIGKGQRFVDLGPETAKKFGEIIKHSKLIIWNGPLGLTSDKRFQFGTRVIADAIIHSGAKSVTGGGDTIEFLDRYNLTDKFGYVSTGGGAMLQFLAGREMPGLEALGISK